MSNPCQSELRECRNTPLAARTAPPDYVESQAEIRTATSRKTNSPGERLALAACKPGSRPGAPLDCCLRGGCASRRFALFCQGERTSYRTAVPCQLPCRCPQLNRTTCVREFRFVPPLRACCVPGTAAIPNVSVDTRQARTRTKASEVGGRREGGDL